MLITISVFIFFFTVLIVLQIINAFTSKQQLLAERIKNASELSGPKTAIRQKMVSVINKGRWVLDISLPVSMLGQKFINNFQDNLLKAGLPFKPVEIITIHFFSVFVSAIIGMALFQTIKGAIIAGIVGLLVPVFWVKINKKRRMVQMENQLLDVVVLISSSLKAGHSFLQALELVGHETRPPLSDEIARVLRENRLGVPMETALNNFKSRVESKDLELFVAGVLIHRQVGGNLAEVLDIIADTMDKRIKLRAKIKTTTAQGRLSAWIICLLPLVMAALTFLRFPEYSHTMLENPLGIALLVVGAAFMVIGIMAVRKVVSIDV